MLSDVENVPLSGVNRAFAEHVLLASLNAADHYLLMSGGRHIHDSGIELYVSAEVAKRLYEHSVALNVPWHGRGSSSHSYKRRDIRTDHVLLEAGGGEIFGEDFDLKVRFDIALISTGFGRGYAAREPFFAIETKLHFPSLRYDVAKRVPLIRNFHKLGWPMLSFGVLGFHTEYADSKPAEDKFSELIGKLQSQYPDFTVSAATMTRGLPGCYDSGGAGDGLPDRISACFAIFEYKT